jgi:hypothetical protein
MAFFKCYGTSLIRLPDSLEYIGNDAFSYCENMRYAVFIPETVKHIGHHAFYKCSNDLKYYMGAASEEGIELGGRWQARSDNKFEADPPFWGTSRKDCDDYNQKLYDEDAKAAAEAEKNTDNNYKSGSSKDEINTTFIKLVMIFFFIPGFMYIGVQVIRAMFKDDFLMTKRGKAKLAKAKEERERIHQSYIEAGKSDEDGESETVENESAGDTADDINTDAETQEETEKGGDE